MNDDLKMQLAVMIDGLVLAANMGGPACECGRTILDREKTLDVLQEVIAVAMLTLINFDEKSKAPGARLHVMTDVEKSTVTH